MSRCVELCVCVFVCVMLYMYTHICVHTSGFRWAGVWSCVHLYMIMYVCVRMCDVIYVHAYMYVYKRFRWAGVWCCVYCLMIMYVCVRNVIYAHTSTCIKTISMSRCVFLCILVDDYVCVCDVIHAHTYLYTWYTYTHICGAYPCVYIQECCVCMYRAYFCLHACICRDMYVFKYTHTYTAGPVRFCKCC
jgi:hypothetical protein